MQELLEDFAVWLHKHFIVIEFATCAFALAAIVYGGLQYYTLQQEYASAKDQLASTTAIYTKITADLRNKFSAVSGQNQTLTDSLTTEQNKNDYFQAQINGVKGTVDQLQKLSETDKELLQKYSKVYFLNENYVPSNLAVLDERYLANPKTPLQFHGKALTFLTRMIDAANSNSVPIKIISAYRSFGTQANLKADYKTTFGTGANKFSAEQGYSEHQLATAIDVAPADGSNTLTLSFATTPASAWLAANAYQYGFILSYPKGNTYYIYEPWHWRFVGVALATRLHNENKNFYDLDQRTIDGYLSLIFD